jgi:hypothetical protein
MALEPVAGSCPPPVGSHTVEVGDPALLVVVVVVVVAVPAGWKPWLGGRIVVVGGRVVGARVVVPAEEVVGSEVVGGSVVAVVVEVVGSEVVGGSVVAVVVEVVVPEVVGRRVVVVVGSHTVVGELEPGSGSPSMRSAGSSSSSSAGAAAGRRGVVSWASWVGPRVAEVGRTS